MFEGLKKELYFKKMQVLFNQGVKDQKIIPFDDDFYDKMTHTYISGIPVSIYIKYLKPFISPGKCYNRSLYMFFCFKNSVLVCGDLKNLELQYGKDDAEHAWIEMDNYVYDPSSLNIFDKDLYYQIYMPTNVSKCTKEEYCQVKNNKKVYDDIIQTTISDFQPHGKKRTDLINTIPLLSGIAQIPGNEQFKIELENWLSTIQYDEKEVYDELNDAIKK